MKQISKSEAFTNYMNACIEGEPANKRWKETLLTVVLQEKAYVDKQLENHVNAIEFHRLDKRRKELVAEGMKLVLQIASIKQ